MTRALAKGPGPGLITLRRPLRAELGRSRLDSREQCLIGEVAVALGALVVRVAEHLPYGEEVDAGRRHERRGGMT